MQDGTEMTKRMGRWLRAILVICLCATGALEASGRGTGPARSSRVEMRYRPPHHETRPAWAVPEMDILREGGGNLRDRLEAIDPELFKPDPSLKPSKRRGLSHDEGQSATSEF